MLHLEARIKKQLFKLLLHFLLFKCSRFQEWNLVHGTHSLLLLEKGIHVQFHKQPHPPEPKLARSILNFRTSCAVLSSVIFPHTQTDKQTGIHSPPTTNCEYFFFFGCCSLSVQDTIVKIYSLGKKKYTLFKLLLPLVLMAKYILMQKINETEPQKQYSLTSNFF